MSFEHIGDGWYECNHVRRHRFRIDGEQERVEVMLLMLAGWFDGSGYCPAYLPRWLGSGVKGSVVEVP